MTPANTEAGEVEIVLEGKPYVLRPSYACRVAIERELTEMNIRDGIPGRSSITDFLRPFLTGARIAPTLEESVALVYNGMLFAAKDRGDKFMQQISRQRIGELLYRELSRSENVLAVSEFMRNLVPLVEEKKKADGPEE